MKTPKRIGHLMERLCTRENALQAIQAVNETRKDNKTAQWVERTKEARAEELCELVRDFRPKPPRTFTRYDATAGKWREINEPALWPDQYVHHMIVQVLTPVLMRGMDHFCCGSIPGRGPQRARKAIEKWLEKDPKGTKYGAELDIKKYYPSLSPREVMRFLRRKIKDAVFLDLVWRIIKDGIKIGFYISQWLANAVLEPLDHFIRERLGVRHYIRYKVAAKQARGILSRAGQLKHCAGWSLYDKHVRPIEKILKDVIREASRKERLKCSST